MREALVGLGVRAKTVLRFVDEMRLGLWTGVRRSWALRGHRVRQRVQWQRGFVWCALALEVRRGLLTWEWLPDLKGPTVREVLKQWKREGIKALVWDGARGHIANEVKRQAPRQVLLPPGSPELDPVERVIQEVRRAVEGRVYATLEEKQAAVEVKLQELAADRAAVRRLVGWEWIIRELRRLPA